jgi:hypothetical protein
MIRKSGYRFSEQIMLNKKREHDPQKWKPLFRRDHAPLKMPERQSVQFEAIGVESMIRKSGSRFSDEIMLH